jgi:hypothetical protein
MEIKAKFYALLTGKEQPVPTKQDAEWARDRHGRYRKEWHVKTILDDRNALPKHAG